MLICIGDGIRDSLLYYYHTSDAIQNLTQVVDDLFTKYSPKNCLTINTFGTDASYNFSFGKFNLYSSVSMFYVKAKSYVDELDDKDLRSLNTSFSANLSYRYKVLNFYANYYHVLPGIEESFHTGNLDCVGLGCKIDIIKNKLLLNIQAQDIFSGTKSNNRTEYKYYVFRNRINNDISCNQLRRYYDDVTLVTDSQGYDVLINKLHLPYTDVIVSLDCLNHYNPNLFASSYTKGIYLVILG